MNFLADFHLFLSEISIYLHFLVFFNCLNGIYLINVNLFVLKCIFIDLFHAKKLFTLWELLKAFHRLLESILPLLYTQSRSAQNQPHLLVRLDLKCLECVLLALSELSNKQVEL